MSVEFNDPIDLNQLEIRNVQLQRLNSNPAIPVEGQIWYRSDEHRPVVNDATTNQELAYLSDVKAHAITSGVISVPGPEWTLKTAPNIITMASCQARIYDNANWTGYPETYTIPEKDFTLVDGQDSMLIISYNSGTPEYQIVDAWNFSAYNLSNTILVYRFWYLFGEIQSASLDSTGNGLCEKQALRLDQTNYYARTGNVGLDLGEVSSPVERTTTISAANVWGGQLPFYIASFNSSTDAFSMVTNNSGIWSKTVITQWPNTYYNNTAGPIPMTNNKYGVVWIYRSIGDTKEAFAVLGKNQYNTESLAAEESPRTDLPYLLYSHCMLVGRYIFQKSATSALSIQSAFSTVFQGAAVSSLPASSVTYVPTGSISSTDVQAAITELDTEKQKDLRYTWTSGAITTGQGWAKILSTTLPNSTSSTVNWVFNVLRMAPSTSTSVRVGVLNIGWRNAVLTATFTQFSGTATTVKFGYTGTLALNSLFEVYGYVSSWPYLTLEPVVDAGGTIAGGLFSATDPLMTDILSSELTSHHNYLEDLQLAQSGVTYGHITDASQTITGAKTFTSPNYDGILTMQRVNALTTGTTWCGQVDEQTSATPADGLGPALAFVISTTSNPTTKYGLGSIQCLRNGNNTSGLFEMEVRRTGISYFPVRLDYSQLQVRSSNSGVGTSIEFYPVIDSSNNYKQSLSWYTTDDALRMYIGRRDGITGGAEEDLRVTQIHSTMALANGCVRIGDQSNATNVNSNGQIAIGARDATYCAIWHGSIAPANRTGNNCSYFMNGEDTYVNSATSTGTIGLCNGNAKNVTLAASPVGKVSLADNTAAYMGGYSTSGWSIWPGNVTPSTGNYSFYSKGDGTSAAINGTTNCIMAVNAVAKITANSAGGLINGTLTATSGLVAESYMSVNGTLSAQNISNSIFTSSATSGTVNWNASTSSVLYLSGQLTGALIVSFTGSPDAGCVQYIYFRQHMSTAQTFTISGVSLNRTIRQSGVSASGASRAVSGVANVAAYYMIKLLWITATTCIISVDAA